MSAPAGGPSPAARGGTDWQEHAACGGHLNLFFGADDETAREWHDRVTQAKAICRPCPARAACREFAQDHRIQFGVWAGVDLERRAGRMCRNGLHLMDEANTWTDLEGHRNCRACRNEADRRSRARQQEGRAA